MSGQRQRRHYRDLREEGKRRTTAVSLRHQVLKSKGSKSFYFAFVHQNSYLHPNTAAAVAALSSELMHAHNMLSSLRRSNGKYARDAARRTPKLCEANAHHKHLILIVTIRIQASRKIHGVLLSSFSRKSGLGALRPPPPPVVRILCSSTARLGPWTSNTARRNKVA